MRLRERALSINVVAQLSCESDDDTWAGPEISVAPNKGLQSASSLYLLALYLGETYAIYQRSTTERLSV